MVIHTGRGGESFRRRVRSPSPPVAMAGRWGVGAAFGTEKNRVQSWVKGIHQSQALTPDRGIKATATPGRFGHRVTACQGAGAPGGSVREAPRFEAAG